jgi:hypothetical protein
VALSLQVAGALLIAETLRVVEAVRLRADTT